MKKWKFLGAPLMFMLLTGMPWCIASAENDVTEPVIVTAGEHVTVGNVSVENNPNAVKVVAANGENDKNASVTVNGNVTLKNQNGAEAVVALGGDGAAQATISGNVSAESETFAVGATSESNDNNYAGTTTIKVNGNVSAKGGESAMAAGAYNGDLIVSGNVMSEGGYAEGLAAYTNRTSNVTVGGGVFATGGYASGARLQTYGGESSSNNLSCTIGNGITANSTGTNEYDGATGLSVNNLGGIISAEITGDVTAKSQSSNSSAVEISEWIEGDAYPGNNKILIHGNLISDSVGIYDCLLGNPTFTEILVENEIRANKVGVLIRDASTVPIEDDTPLPTSGKLNLTVWKIRLNENGNVAENIIPGDLTNPDIPRYTSAKDFEKEIMYIIKVEQPEEGGTIKAVDANGNALAKSFGFDVAHEGDKIVLKTNLAKGYKIVGAYNGNGEKVPLLKDGNGNYYIIVPKGGGVYLGIELEDTTEHNYAEPDDNNKTVSYDSEETGSKNNNAKSAEKLNSKSNTDSSTPKTGDNNQVCPWLILSVISIGGIAGIELCNKKNLLKKAENK